MGRLGKGKEAGRQGKERKEGKKTRRKKERDSFQVVSGKCYEKMIKRAVQCLLRWVARKSACATAQAKASCQGQDGDSEGKGWQGRRPGQENQLIQLHVPQPALEGKMRDNPKLPAPEEMLRGLHVLPH